MKKYFRIIRTLFITFIVLGFLSSLKTWATPLKVDDTIIAIVNQNVITLKDLREFLNTVYIQLRSQGKTEQEMSDIIEEYQKNGIERLVESKLLVDAANKKDVKIRDKAIDDKIGELKKNYTNDEEFLSALIKEGLTVTDLRKRISDEMKAKFIVDLEIHSKVFVNPNEVTEYYQQNPTEFNKLERVDLDSIYIPYGENNHEEAEGQINAALEELKKGANFAETAKKYSKSPSIGTIDKGQMLPAVENVVFNLKEGEVSNPCKIDNGIYIFRLNKHYPPEKASLDEVKDQIYDFLFHRKYQKKLSAWLSDLKKQAYVEIKN